MGNNRPVKVKDWIKFLKAHGCVELRKSKGSHVLWKCKNSYRTIVFRKSYKEIPPLHLKTNLQSMGYDLNYLYEWLSKNK